MNDLVASTPEPVPFSRVAPFVLKYRWLLFEIAVISIALRLLTLVEPFAFQAVIDRVLPFQRQQTLVTIVIVLLAVALFQAALGAISFYLSQHTGNRITSDLGRELYGHMMRLHLPFAQSWPVGEMLARVGEIGAVSGFLSSTVASLALDVLFGAIYLAVLFSLSPTLALVILALLPIQIALFVAFGPLLRRRLQAQFLEGSAQQARIVETLGNAVTIKALGAEAPFTARLSGSLDRTLSAGMRVATIQNWSGTLEGILGRVVTVAILLVGSNLILAGELTLGQLIAFYLLQERVAGPLLALAGLWESLQQLKVSRTRLGEVWNEPPEPDDRPPLPTQGPGTVMFEAVRFGYDPDRPVLNGVSFSASPGQPFLVVGPSGAGKSTIGKLACGLYQPDRGHVTVDGHVLADYDPVSVRQAIAYVPQDALLFDGTVRENLTAMAPDASDADLRRTLRLAVAEELVEQLPYGLDTPVGERGGQLSGGQRQRIALARTLLTDSLALVLDEPTSALDPDTQAVLARNVVDLARDRTVIVITHRPDLFGNAPSLVVGATEERDPA